MPELQRITCEYSEPEDRTRLIGEPVQALALDSSNEPKQVIVLWLSQRLLSRLVSYLCKHLEMENISALQAEIQQTFAQQAAMAALEPQPPVSALAANGSDRNTTSGTLIHSIDVTAVSSALQMAFKDAEQTIVGRLSMAPQPLRQWLQIVFEQYQRAQWSLEVWPTWVTETRRSSTYEPTWTTHLH